MPGFPHHPFRASILLVGLAAIVASLGAGLTQAATKPGAANGASGGEIYRELVTVDVAPVVTPSK